MFDVIEEHLEPARAKSGSKCERAVRLAPSAMRGQLLDAFRTSTLPVLLRVPYRTKPFFFML
jgi:hypothetical protein